jgi:hypothetical protein
LERDGLAELFPREAAVAGGRCRADDARAAFVEAALAIGFALGLAAVRAGAWDRAAVLATGLAPDFVEAVARGGADRGRAAAFAGDFAFAFAATALAGGFALAAGLALTAALALATGFALTTGFGFVADFGRAAELAFAAGLALATDFGLALVLVVTVEAALTTGLAFVAGLAVGTFFAFTGDATLAAVAGLAAGLAGTAEDFAGAGLATVTATGAAGLGGAGSRRTGAAVAGFGGAGATASAGVGVAAPADDAAPSERSTGGRGPRSDTRTGSTIIWRSSAARSGVSEVSRHVKATTSLKSGCRSNRTIAVWLNTVSTIPLEPTG